ncbi:MAG: hypothetical protein LQ340_004277 [Diploschistes diacapsis]|nr:MAG: hypothetical protein LQ340_004277 [Diploschistes diacapsis]
MVDLPGLFEAGSRDQSEEDAELVKSLVLSYISKQRTIILAAKSDFNVQSVIKYARKLDPKGERTLGLITKPDTLDQGYGTKVDRYSKRLRAVVQNSLLDFAAILRDQGHTFNIVNFRPPDNLDNLNTLTRDEYVDKEQSTKWKDIIHGTVEKIVEFAYLFVTDVIRYIADESTAERLLQRMNSSMQILYSHVNQKVEEIYQNVSHSYPITYNHYFTENLRKAQQQRQEEDIRIALEPFSREDMPANKAMYAMQAYYKVATIVDDIAKLAIEQTFLRGLDSLLCLDFVCSLNDSDLDWIAGETDAISFDRNHFEQKIKVLEGGIDELKARSHYFVLIAPIAKF